MAIRISLRQGMAEGSTSGEYEKAHTDLPEVAPTCQVSLRGNGLPQVCALVRNDMRKPEACLRLQGRNDMHKTCRCSRVQEGFPNGHRGLGRDLLRVCPLAPNDTEKTALFPRGGNAATEDDP